MVRWIAPVTVVAGHYGSGKTTLSLNLAYHAAAEGCDVTLADMDVVNPYFRSGEYRAELEEAGIKVITPVFGGAGTSLDVPSVTNALEVAAQEAFEAYAQAPDRLPRKVLIVDAGGDDVGATVLARFALTLQAGPSVLWQVLNASRLATQTPADALEIMRAIEATCRLKTTHVYSNTHLGNETRPQHIHHGITFAEEVSRLANVPLIGASVPLFTEELARECAPLLQEFMRSYPLTICARPPW
jgi:ABC-type cobalamin/Fe3+-siderophores transport system ATPase subunit